ncbi:MAG: hypothetical protein JST10_05460 [Bacteroidetes bacterium]|nr:hypothetical protein [Bacteroidota bacterium]
MMLHPSALSLLLFVLLVSIVNAGREECVELAKQVKSSLALDSQQPVNLPSLEILKSLKQCIYKFGYAYKSVLKEIIRKNNPNELSGNISRDTAIKLRLLVFKVFPEVEFEKYDDGNPEESLRTGFLKMAENIYEKLKNIQESDEEIASSSLFNPIFNAVLFKWYFHNHRKSEYKKPLDNRVFKENSNDLYEKISFKNAIELAVLVFEEFPEVQFAGYDDVNPEKSLQSGFEEMAKDIYEKLKMVKQNDLQIATSSLFDPLVSAKLLKLYFHQYMPSEFKGILDILLFKNAYELRTKISLSKAMQLGLLLFKAFYKRWFDNPNTSVEGLLAPIAKKAYSNLFDIEDQKDKSEVSTIRLFDHPLNATLCKYYLDELSSAFCSNFRSLLYGKSNILLGALPLDSALKLKLILARVFKDEDVFDIMQEETSKPFCIRIMSRIYQNIEPTNVEVHINKIVSEPEIDAYIVKRPIDKVGRDQGQKVDRLFKGRNQQDSDQVQKSLTPLQLEQLRETLFEALPEVAIKDFLTRGQEAVRPFCVDYAKKVYGKNYTSLVYTSEFLKTTSNTDAENRHNARLLTWCIQKFSGDHIEKNAKELLYKDDGIIYKEILHFDATELERYLFQVFPELETDDKKFDYASDRTKAFCKDLIVDAHKNLEGKAIETTERVFGSHLKAKLAVACLQMLGEDTYEEAKKILYVEPTYNIYPIIGKEGITQLSRIFEHTKFILKILSRDGPDITEKAVEIASGSEKLNEPTPKQSSKNGGGSDAKN